MSRSHGTPPTPIGREALRRQVPAATFRGPLHGRTLRAPTPESQRRTERNVNNWLRGVNMETRTAARTRPNHDIVGNRIPSDAELIGPSTLRRINPHFDRMERDFGPPAHRFAFLPRDERYKGFFERDDGSYAYHHYHHHVVVVSDFYYPYYFSDPLWFAFYYPGYYPAAYSLWGWCPGWIYPDRVYYEPFVYVALTTAPRTSVDEQGAERAINDIRHAWLEGDLALLNSHLTNQVDVRIYFNGDYSYTTTTDDYYGMTADTMSTTQTIEITFDKPIWISADEVFFAGRQVFQDPDGTQHTLYISYQLRKLGSDWYVVAFGSSTTPIHSRYTDFRYR